MLSVDIIFKHRITLKWYFREVKNAAESLEYVVELRTNGSAKFHIQLMVIIANKSEHLLKLVFIQEELRFNDNLYSRG